MVSLRDGSTYPVILSEAKDLDIESCGMGKKKSLSERKIEYFLVAIVVEKNIVEKWREAAEYKAFHCVQKCEKTERFPQRKCPENNPQSAFHISTENCGKFKATEKTDFVYNLNYPRRGYLISTLHSSLSTLHTVSHSLPVVGVDV